MGVGPRTVEAVVTSTPSPMSDRRHPDELTWTSRDIVEISGLVVDNLDETGTVSHIDRALADGRGGWVVTANSDFARLCSQRRDVRDLIRAADLTLADGMPLIWASRIRGTPLRARVCGSDLVWSIAQRAAESGYSLFLLGGGRPGTAVDAGSLMEHRFPGLRIAGTYYPPFGFEKDETEMARLRASLAKADPDIVYVALGFPKAELLIQQLRGFHPKTWWIGVGISLSFIAGEVKRAPKWMQSSGLE